MNAKTLARLLKKIDVLVDDIAVAKEGASSAQVAAAMKAIDKLAAAKRELRNVATADEDSKAAANWS